MNACGSGDLFPSVPQSLVLPGCWWLEPNVNEPDRPALFAHDGALITRRSLAAAVGALAGLLVQEGVGRTDRLAVVMAPGVDLATCLLAGMAVAAVAPLVPSSPLGVVLDDLRRLRVTHVLVDGDPPAAAVEAAQELGLPLLHLDPLARSAEPAARLTVPAAADLALLLQTSGTTSRPKVVPFAGYPRGALADRALDRPAPWGESKNEALGYCRETFRHVASNRGTCQGRA